MPSPAAWFKKHFKTHPSGVFPVYNRTKIPAVPSWDDYECTVAEAEAFTDYGVRLGVLAVADSDTPETEAWAQEYLPHTPFVVKTARGRHRYYYALADSVPNFFHRDGLTIEFRNTGQYVIGPGSTHQTGVIYRADDWSWNPDDIPAFDVANFVFDDRPPSVRGSTVGHINGFKMPEVIHAGERHDQMYRMCRALKIRGVLKDAALAACLVENQIHCVPPLQPRAIEQHLRRVYDQPMRKGFIPYPLQPLALIAGLSEAGFAYDAILKATTMTWPKFDPNNPDAEHESQSNVLIAEDQDEFGWHWSQYPQFANEERPGRFLLRNGRWLFVPELTAATR